MISDLKTKLISISAPAPDFAVESGARKAEDILVYCARVSNPGNQSKFDSGQKLIRYLIEHKHWSHFEIINLVVEVEAPRTITRQMLRHRSCAFQEFSGRYAEFQPQDFMLSETRRQDPVNRQNSFDTEDQVLRNWWENAQIEVLELAYAKYKEALDRGVAKELARDVLPEGLTPSRMYIQGTLRSWFHYCQIRCEPKETQREHVALATQIYNKIIIPNFPSLRDVSVSLAGKATQSVRTDTSSVTKEPDFSVLSSQRDYQGKPLARRFDHLRTKQPIKTGHGGPLAGPYGPYPTK